jgi:hypothetical protein
MYSNPICGYILKNIATYSGIYGKEGMESMELIQIITSFVALATLVLCFRRMRKQPQTKLVNIPTIILMVHVLIFYTATFLRYAGIIPAMGISSDWSSILRLQSVGTFFIISYYGYKRGQLWDKHQ